MLAVGNAELDVLIVVRMRCCNVHQIQRRVGQHLFIGAEGFLCTVLSSKSLSTGQISGRYGVKGNIFTARLDKLLNGLRHGSGNGTRA